jgi:hypothetical protein
VISIDTQLDINKLTDVLLAFADYKRRQADEKLNMAGGLFREKNYEAGRRLRLEARDIIRYAEEIKEWWASDLMIGK